MKGELVAGVAPGREGVFAAIPQSAFSSQHHALQQVSIHLDTLILFLQRLLRQQLLLRVRGLHRNVSLAN